MFADRAKIYVRSGKGGDGHVSFRREKYVPSGGPDGGDGGHGGDVIFVVDEGLNTLIDFRHIRKYKAGDGEEGGKKNCRGKDGEDIIIKVPAGTVIKEAQSGQVITDMSGDNKRVVLLKGGKGGNGNQHYATSTMQAPKYAQPGQAAQELELLLELKVIADVGLVGFPNVGKSTFLSRVTNARPKIANYHFTTLNPNLGVVDLEGTGGFVIADIPGLIEGASEGIGLGHEFLRHIERTEIIAHVIDCATLEPDRDPMSDYHALENELALYADKLELPLGAIPIPERPRIVILNKIDVPEAKELAEFVRPEFEKLGLKVFEISTASHEGLKELNFALSALVHEMREEVANREQAEEEARVVIKPLETKGRRPRRADEGGSALEFTVERRELGNGEVFFEVRGVKPERWVMQTNFDNDEAVGYLADRLAKLGVEDELRRKGAHPGDEVRIGRGARMVEFDWDPTISAGAEMLDGSNLGARGKDLRLEELDPRTHRRSNAERRAQYHEMMDARAAVRDAMMAERKAGHWADPTVDDDRHDETSLFGHGESSEDGETEE